MQFSLSVISSEKLPVNFVKEGRKEGRKEARKEGRKEGRKGRLRIRPLQSYIFKFVLLKCIRAQVRDDET